MHFTRVNRIVSRSCGDECGFSLLEAIIASGLMAGALAALGQMFAISVANNRSARAASYATVLAQQKMEQLRGLTWGFETLGLPISDTTSNTAASV
jgi:Tfp pilus assembly protein PilV